MSILGELRRRHVFRVAATYVVASWLIVEVVTTISDTCSGAIDEVGLQKNSE